MAAADGEAVTHVVYPVDRPLEAEGSWALAACVEQAGSEDWMRAAAVGLARWSESLGHSTSPAAIERLMQSERVFADEFLSDLFELLGVPMPPAGPAGFEGATWIFDSGPVTSHGKTWEPRTARYVVGYGEGFTGIWDRERQGHPIERFAGPDAVLQAYERIAELLFPPPQEFAEATVVYDTGIERWNRRKKLNLARARYVLGRGRDFIGIWDRKRPGPPLARFPKNRDGERDSLEEYARLMRLPPPEF